MATPQQQPSSDSRGPIEELETAVRAIQALVDARHPKGERGHFSIPLANLLPLLHARDAAEAKVAAIGSVNPRPGGLVNQLIQAWKRTTARLLNWFVRDQVDFNQGVMRTVQATLDALNEQNRALAQISQALDELAGKVNGLPEGLRATSDRLAELEQRAPALQQSVGQLRQQTSDLTLHWQQWRQEWEKNLSTNEIQFLRSVADLNAAYQHRTQQLAADYRTLANTQHQEFLRSLQLTQDEINAQSWKNLREIRQELERLIQQELRLVRQRALLAPPGPSAAAPPTPSFSSHSTELPAQPTYDFLHFAERFRGTREYVASTQQQYLPLFQGLEKIADLGCGRGEFLALLAQSGHGALGIDGDQESVDTCRSLGLTAEKHDIFAWLAGQPDESWDALVSFQVIEHLPPALVPVLIRESARVLRRGGLLLLETPNPECLAIFATHFYLDPTHQRPVPPPLTQYYLQEAGFGDIEIRKLSPAEDTMPALKELSPAFRQAFFGALDYAAIARKL